MNERISPCVNEPVVLFFLNGATFIRTFKRRRVSHSVHLPREIDPFNYSFSAQQATNQHLSICRQPLGSRRDHERPCCCTQHPHPHPHPPIFQPSPSSSQSTSQRATAPSSPSEKSKSITAHQPQKKTRRRNAQTHPLEKRKSNIHRIRFAKSHHKGLCRRQKSLSQRR